MRNEIILNGIPSTNITGLIIQSLPPISKPLMRTQIEVIDGRDGDIVTNLGYSAYDKEISIGLYGDYDVDDVIAFFDSKGTVTFSNEDDKYYNYQIIEQIDFERLIRFKTATVTFHVQPFKYSTIENTLVIGNQLLDFPNNIIQENEVSLIARNNSITIIGSPTKTTEIYMPINVLNLEAGEYTLNAYASGTSPTSCSMRLINNSPSDANSFGGTYITLQDGTSTINSFIQEKQTYNYLYFYITAGAEINVYLNVALNNNNGTVESAIVTNTGNIFSRPTITLYGNGNINLSLNNSQIFVIALGDEGYITLDSAQMEASRGGILKNRLVTGNYDNLVFNIGKNTLSWTGNVTEVDISNYSRWI